MKWSLANCVVKKSISENWNTTLCLLTLVSFFMNGVGWDQSLLSAEPGSTTTNENRECHNLEWLSKEDVCTLIKVAWSQKVFHFSSNLPKKSPNHYSVHVLFNWIVLRIMIWHLFGEIAAKVKHFYLNWTAVLILKNDK